MSLFGVESEFKESDLDIWNELLNEPEFNLVNSDQQPNAQMGAVSQATPLVFTDPLQTGLFVNQAITPAPNTAVRTEDSNQKKRDHSDIISNEPASKRSKFKKNEYNSSFDIEKIQSEIRSLNQEVKEHEVKCKSELAEITDKKHSKLIRNRHSAAVSRANTKIKNLEREKTVLQLRDKVKKLEKELEASEISNGILNRQNRDLRKENEYLKGQVSSDRTLQFTNQSTLIPFSLSVLENESTKRVNSFDLK